MESSNIFPPAPPRPTSDNIDNNEEYLSDLSDEFNPRHHIMPEAPTQQPLALDEVTYDRDIRLINVPVSKQRQLYNPDANSAPKTLYDVPDDSRFPRKSKKDKRERRTKDKSSRNEREFSRSYYDRSITKNVPSKIMSRSEVSDDAAIDTTDKPQDGLALDDVPYDRSLKYINKPSGERHKPRIASQDNRVIQQLQSITMSNADELQKLDQHYVKLGSKKKDYDTSVSQDIRYQRGNKGRFHNNSRNSTNEYQSRHADHPNSYKNYNKKYNNNSNYHGNDHYRGNYHHRNAYNNQKSYEYRNQPRYSNTTDHYSFPNYNDPGFSAVPDLNPNAKEFIPSKGAEFG